MVVEVLEGKPARTKGGWKAKEKRQKKNCKERSREGKNR